MRKLNLMDWERIINYCEENNEDIEILWLDSMNKYGLVIECDILETFYYEKSAYEFLAIVEENIARIPEVKSYLKDIINNKQKNINECIENILEYDEMMLFDRSYIWGNVELVYDYDNETWQFIDLYGKYCNVDYELVNYMSRVLLEDIEKWQNNKRAL